MFLSIFIVTLIVTAYRFVCSKMPVLYEHPVSRTPTRAPGAKHGRFPTLYSFMIFTKGWTYVLMGVALVGFLGYWRFLFGRDERTGRPE